MAKPAYTHANGGAVLGNRVRVHDEADQFLLRIGLREPRKRVATDEIRLVEFCDPRHAGFVRARKGVGIHADNNVAFLEPQQPLRFHAKRPDAKTSPSLQQFVPEVLAILGREVNFPSGFAHKSDA